MVKSGQESCGQNACYRDAFSQFCHVSHPVCGHFCGHPIVKNPLFIRYSGIISQKGNICEIVNNHDFGIMIRFHINYVLVWKNGGLVWKR